VSVSPGETHDFWRARRAAHPHVRHALLRDAEIALRHRGERHEFRSPYDAVVQLSRLAWQSDAFLAQALYRVKARMQALGVPILPRVAHRLAMILAQVTVGDPVVISPGVYIVHGQVVIDGLSEIGAGVVISPFVTVGLRAGELVGPTIEPDVFLGTGAKILGPVRVGAGAIVGAGAVVVDDVAPGSTVTGVPARP
jgi:serine O-acetyltransferase